MIEMRELCADDLSAIRAMAGGPAWYAGKHGQLDDELVLWLCKSLRAAA
jgi:hypothetical protein